MDLGATRWIPKLDGRVATSPAAKQLQCQLITAQAPHAPMEAVVQVKKEDFIALVDRSITENFAEKKISARKILAKMTESVKMEKEAPNVNAQEDMKEHCAKKLIIVLEAPAKIMEFARLKRLTLSVRVQVALEERNVIELVVTEIAKTIAGRSAPPFLEKNVKDGTQENLMYLKNSLKVTPNRGPTLVWKPTTAEIRPSTIQFGATQWIKAKDGKHASQRVPNWAKTK